MLSKNFLQATSSVGGVIAFAVGCFAFILGLSILLELLLCGLFFEALIAVAATCLLSPVAALAAWVATFVVAIALNFAWHVTAGVLDLGWKFIKGAVKLAAELATLLVGGIGFIITAPFIWLGKGIAALYHGAYNNPTRKHASNTYHYSSDQQSHASPSSDAPWMRENARPTHEAMTATQLPSDVRQRTDLNVMTDEQFQSLLSDAYQNGYAEGRGSAQPAYGAPPPAAPQQMPPAYSAQQTLRIPQRPAPRPPQYQQVQQTPNGMHETQSSAPPILHAAYGTTQYATQSHQRDPRSPYTQGQHPSGLGQQQYDAQSQQQFPQGFDPNWHGPAAYRPY